MHGAACTQGAAPAAYATPPHPLAPLRHTQTEEDAQLPSAPTTRVPAKERPAAAEEEEEEEEAHEPEAASAGRQLEEPLAA